MKTDFMEQDARDLVESDEAVEASLAPADGGAAVPISGFFRSSYGAEDLGGLESGGQALRFQCLTIDVPVGARRGTLTINGEAYRIQEPRENDPARLWSTLYLVKK